MTLLPLWALAVFTPAQRAPAGRWLSLLVRTVLICALVLALAGMRLVYPTNALTTVFLLDRSDSITADAQAQAVQFVRQAVHTMQPGDRAAIVAFGANAVVEQSPTELQSAFDLQALPVASGTNIQAAVQLGLALLPAETNQRLVLLSDGGQNAGDAQAAAQLAAARGVPLSYVDLSQPESAGEAQLSDLHAPATAHTGQAFDLTVTVASTVAQRAQLRVFADDQLIYDQEVALQSGANMFKVPVQPVVAGFPRYRAEIIPQQDARSENNTAAAVVRVDSAPRVLIATKTQAAAAPLYTALSAAQIGVQVISPDQVPTDLNELGTYDAVVLLNIPANALPVAAMSVLPTYVRDLGHGLVMIGGDTSYALGGYGKTLIEDVLPVYMDAPTSIDRPDLALVFVLDTSYSMGGCHCRGPDRKRDGYYDDSQGFNIDIAKQAVQQAVSVLNPNDIVSVVTFDDVAKLLFPPQLGVTPNGIMSAISPARPSGSTNINAGLALAQQTLLQTNASVKHIILFTDGLGQNSETLAMAQQFAQQGITISVVGEGFGAVDYLQQLAQAGNGRYLQVKDNPTDIPKIFLQETMTASSKLRVEHAFTPRYGSSSPILAGLDQGLPQLYGYNGTTPKQTAMIALSDDDGTPVLAQWQYGLGRSVAWTSDTGGHWAKDWVAWPEFPRFAAQLVGWVLPTSSASGLTVDLHADSAQSKLTVTALNQTNQPRPGLDLHATIIDPNGVQHDLPLAATAPGTYQSSTANLQPGTYQVQIAGSQNGHAITPETVGLVVPYSAEYRLGQSSPALLAALARTSGGARLAQPADSFARVSQHAGNAQELALPLLLLALVLLPIDIAMRRLAGYRRLRARSVYASR